MAVHCVKTGASEWARPKGEPRMLQRVSAAWAAGREAVVRASGREAAGREAAGLLVPTTDPGQLQPKPRPGEAAWALIHFGEARDLTGRLAAHRAFCQKSGFRCLLVADDIPALCVTSREVTFEFVPWPGQTARLAPGGHAAAVDHAVRRLGLALDFWQAVGCDCEGARAEALVDLAPGWSHPAILAARARRCFSTGVTRGKLSTT
jgi:hypothetical protein